MANCNSNTCSIDGRISPQPPPGNPAGSVAAGATTDAVCVTCGRVEAMCPCGKSRYKSRFDRGARLMAPIARFASPVGSPVAVPPLPPVSVPATAQIPPPPVATPVVVVRPPTPAVSPLPTRTPAPVATPALVQPTRTPPPTLVAAPPATMDLVGVAPTPANPTPVPPYCGDPRFKDTELCRAREDGSMPPALDDYCARRLQAVGLDALRQDELCGDKVPPAATTRPSGAADSFSACYAAFLGLRPDQQARVVEDGVLGSYAMSQSVANDLRRGVTASAKAWADWLGRTFAENSQEIREFCGSSMAHARSYAPSGAVSGVVDDRAYVSPVYVRAAGEARVARMGQNASATPYLKARGLLASESAVPPEVEQCLAFMRGVPPEVFALALAATRIGNHGLVDNAYSQEVYRSLRAGLDVRSRYLDYLRDLVLWYAQNDTARYHTIRAAIAEFCRQAEMRIISSKPAGAVDEGVIDDATARVLFTRLPPKGKIGVLRGVAFPGQAYAASLANAIQQEMQAVDGVPVDALLFAWMDNTFAPGDPHRVLFAYDVSLVARDVGLLGNPSGDITMPATTVTGRPPAPANRPATPSPAPTPNAQGPSSDFLASAGLTADQWNQLVREHPDLAARLMSEYNARPSTFSQVSQTILQAADRVLQGVHQSAVDDLAAQRAAADHAQAMARIALERENARTERAMALAGITPALSTATTPATTPAVTPETTVLPVTTATTPATTPPAEESKTGTYVAVGAVGLVLAAGAYGFHHMHQKQKRNDARARARARAARQKRASSQKSA